MRRGIRRSWCCCGSPPWSTGGRRRSWSTREHPHARRAWMLLSVVVNLGMLGYFKYGGFLMENFAALMAVARRRRTSRPSSTSCCRSAFRSTPSPRCPTRWTSTCGARSRRTTSSTTRCSSPSSRTWSPGRSCGRPNWCRSSSTRIAPRRRQLRFGLALMMLGLFQKVVLADGFLAPGGRSGVRRAAGHGAGRARCVDGHAGLQRADLLRLRRLLDHRDRRGDVPGLRDARQLPLSVRGGGLLRFLAALAHHPVGVAARLPLHPARRQPARPGAHLLRADGDDAARRAVAWRELDVRRVGRVARAVSRGRARAACALRRLRARAVGASSRSACSPTRW